MTRVLFVVLFLTLIPCRQAAAQPPDPPQPSGDAGEPGRTRLLIGPTARALDQGKFYVDFSAVVGGPFVQVGLTDRVSIGAGTPVLIPGIRPGDVFVVTPKVQVFAGRKVDAALGVLHASGGSAAHAGIAYAVVTRGTSDAAVTGGIGIAYRSVSRMGPDGAPIVMLSGEKRVTPRLKVISENYAGPGGGLLCGGVRLTRGHGTFDIGVAAWLGSGRPLVAPIFRFAWSL